MPDTDILPRALRSEPAFRWRGGDVSRLEALSDAVFALSLTLLVVALEVPRSSHDLVRLIWQFPAFGVCFAFLLWVWYEHYIYHRRFGFEDAAAVALNGLLLFCVVFYVYPLKFLAAALITAPLAGREVVQLGAQTRPVMLLYNGGFVGIFAVTSLMYWRAWRLRVRLGLNAAEQQATLGSIRAHGVSLLLGCSALVIAVVSERWAGTSGLVYFLMGPVHAANGVLTSRRIREAS